MGDRHSRHESRLWGASFGPARCFIAVNLFLLPSAAPRDGPLQGCVTDPAPSAWRERWCLHSAGGADWGLRQTHRKGSQLLHRVGKPHAAHWSTAAVVDPGRVLELDAGAWGLFSDCVLSRECWARLPSEQNSGRVLLPWEGLLLNLGLDSSHQHPPIFLTASLQALLGKAGHALVLRSPRGMDGWTDGD